MIIQVTQEHIDNGLSDDCILCPIALAFFDVLAIGLLAHVSSGGFRLMRRENKEIVHSGYLPKEARYFISRFDDCEETKPISFDVDIPAEFVL